MSKKDCEKLNFTVGPVMSSPEVLAVGGSQVPYFRTAEFSSIMKENERLIKAMMKAPENARAVFLTGSGTAAMEAAVMNCLTKEDRAVVVNGGSFGARFSAICRTHEIPYDEICLQAGSALTEAELALFEQKGYTAFLVNLGETSTGVLYDLPLISAFCRRNGLFLIVDAISAFLADEIDMEKSGADVVLTGSQKALALAPGVSVLVLSEKAQARIAEHPARCMYFDLSDYLKNMERGQTPFTPAVGILLQMNERLRILDAAGGAEVEHRRIAALAVDFRSKITGLPFELFAQTPSNAVTALRVTGKTAATEIFETLKNEYDIFVCPNGGELRDTVLRVGHIGCLTEKDNDILIAALHDMKEKGRLIE